MAFPPRPWTDGQVTTDDGVRRVFQQIKNRWKIDSYVIGGSTKRSITSDMFAPGAVRPDDINLRATFGLTAPPDPPLVAMAYVPAAPATGAFEGHVNHVGQWDGVSWTWTDPATNPGMLLVDVATGFVRGWNPVSSAWNVNNGPKGDPGSPGTQGLTGPKGDPGTAAQGVPAGGTTGQYLKKLSNVDYNTGWVDPDANTGGGITVDDLVGKARGALIIGDTNDWAPYVVRGTTSSAAVANGAAVEFLVSSTNSAGASGIYSASVQHPDIVQGAKYRWIGITAFVPGATAGGEAGGWGGDKRAMIVRSE